MHRETQQLVPFDIHVLGSVTLQLLPSRHGIYFFNHLFLIGGWLLYNTMSVSAICPHESATGICASPPSWTSFPLPPHPHPLGCHRTLNLSSLNHIANSHQVSYFTYGNIHVSTPLSPLSPPSPSPALPTVCSLCLFLHCCPADSFISTVFLGSNTYASTCDICLSLSDLLHSV